MRLPIKHEPKAGVMRMPEVYISNPLAELEFPLTILVYIAIAVLVAAPPVLWGSLFPQKQLLERLVSLQSARSKQTERERANETFLANPLDWQIYETRLRLDAEQVLPNFRYREMLTYCCFVACLVAGTAMSTAVANREEVRSGVMPLLALATATVPLLCFMVLSHPWSKRMERYLDYLCRRGARREWIADRARHFYSRAVISHWIMTAVAALAYAITIGHSEVRGSGQLQG
jgi:hypothetical protein